MLKNVVSITGDVLLVLILIGIVLMSTITVIGLNPRGVEKYITDNSVLGVETSKYGLSFSNTYEENPYFKVEAQKNPGNLYQRITYGPSVDAKFYKEIFSIENSTNSDKNFKITVKVPPQNYFRSTIGVKVNTKEFFLIDYKADTENFITGKLQSNSKTKIEIVVTQSDDMKEKGIIEVYAEEI